MFPSTSTHTEPDGDRWFDLEVVASTEAGGVKLDALREEVKEFFAPAQFWEMSDDEKLSAPAGGTAQSVLSEDHGAPSEARGGAVP